MSLSARMYDPADYAVISKWWPAHGWPMVAEPVLPKCGVVVECGQGIARAAAWLYMDNSTGVCWMEWVVTNPFNTPRESLAAIKYLIGAIKDQAVSMDYGIMLTSARQEALIRAYEKCGFSKTDERMTHMIMLTKQ